MASYRRRQYVPRGPNPWTAIGWVLIGTVLGGAFLFGAGVLFLLALLSSA